MECVVFLGKIEGVQRAGLIAEAFGNHIGNVNGQIFIPVSVLTNYRVCVTACNLLAKAADNPDTLTIDLKLCNASVNPFSPWFYISSNEVRFCDSPAATFTALAEPHVSNGTTVSMDRMGFDPASLEMRECRFPRDPRGAPGPGQFKFRIDPQGINEP